MASGEIETYFEMLSTGIEDSPMQIWLNDPMIYTEDGPIFDVTWLPTFRPINTEDFDGTCVWSFEIVGRNKSEKNDATIYAVDENGAVCATLTVPKNSWGPIGPTSEGGLTRADGYKGSDLYTYRGTLIPTPGSHSYGLRVTLPNVGALVGWASDAIVQIDEATIILHQTNPTKSAIHIPMMTDVNASNMNWNDESIFLGEPCVTNGSESLSTELDQIENYEDCELPDHDDYLGHRQIWKFDESELATLDRVVFDAGIGFNSPTVYPSLLTIYGVETLSWCRACLRWAIPAQGLGNFVSGTYTTEEAIDALDVVFTMVAGSDSGPWSLSSDGSTWNKHCVIDVASLTAADGMSLYVASNENAYGGEGGVGPYHQWGVFRNFSIPAGRTVTSAWVDYSVYIHIPTGLPRFHISFSYALDNAINPGYIILYDVTADAYILGSELIWDEWVPWEKKSVTLPASSITSGHEYKARWKSGTEIAEWSANPMVSDINLHLYVINMSAFTSWHRVTKNWGTNPIYNWVYSDWGERKPDADSNDPGTINILSRAKLFKPVGSKVYYEVCAIEFTYGDGYDPALYRSALWDCGSLDNGIGVSTSEEVKESILSWTVPGLGYAVRKRTADIAQFMTDQNRYVDQQPMAPDEYFYWPLSGFIITNYPFTEETEEFVFCVCPMLEAAISIADGPVAARCKLICPIKASIELANPIAKLKRCLVQYLNT
jgi:hypothetical protein